MSHRRSRVPMQAVLDAAGAQVALEQGRKVLAGLHSMSPVLRLGVERTAWSLALRHFEQAEDLFYLAALRMAPGELDSWLDGAREARIQAGATLIALEQEAMP